MRLTVTMLGFEFDVTFGPASQAVDEECVVELGSATSYPLGFGANPAVPWDDAGSPHQFEPD